MWTLIFSTLLVFMDCRSSTPCWEQAPKNKHHLQDKMHNCYNSRQISVYHWSVIKMKPTHCKFFWHMFPFGRSAKDDIQFICERMDASSVCMYVCVPAKKGKGSERITTAFQVLWNSLVWNPLHLQCTELSQKPRSSSSKVYGVLVAKVWKQIEEITRQILE